MGPSGRALLLPCGTETQAAVPLPEYGEPFLVGREPPADLPLRDATVSREHARFAADGDAWILEDAGSANGTFVNGRRVTRRRLRNGDRVRFGSSMEFRFRTERAPSPLAEALRSLFRHELVARNPDAKPRRIPVGPGARVVGRSANAQVRLPFPEISEVHARLENRRGRPWVLDQKSRNGTFVNGEAVRERMLRPGDEVAFGPLPYDVVLTPMPTSRGYLGAAVACLIVAAGALGIGLSGRGGGETLWTREMYEDHARRALGDALEAADRRPPAEEIAKAHFDIAIRALKSADRLSPGDPTREEIEAAFSRYADDLSKPLAGRSMGRVYFGLLEEEQRRAQAAVPEPPPPPPPTGDLVAAELTRIVAEFGIDVVKYPVPPALLEEVRRFVEHWSGANRAYTVRSMERAQPYLAMIRMELRRSHLPEVFCYLPFVESGYREKVASGAGAQGMWQFMKSTGTEYGLKVTDTVDERTDPLLSTRAACRYLEGLLVVFGTDAFDCAVAAYNKGHHGMLSCLMKNVREGNVNLLSRWKFWDLVESGSGCLKQETIEYVPKFLAAAIVMRRPEAFGFPAGAGGGSAGSTSAGAVPPSAAGMPAPGTP